VFQFGETIYQPQAMPIWPAVDPETVKSSIRALIVAALLERGRIVS